MDVKLRKRLGLSSCCQRGGFPACPSQISKNHGPVVWGCSQTSKCRRRRVYINLLHTCAKAGISAKSLMMTTMSSNFQGPAMSQTLPGKVHSCLPATRQEGRLCASIQALKHSSPGGSMQGQVIVPIRDGQSVPHLLAQGLRDVHQSGD